MIDYVFADIGNSVNKSIEMLLSVMCKTNKINQQKQDYRIFFSKEKMFIENNKVQFTSGSKKYLSFYGKIYVGNFGKITETIHSDSGDILLNPLNNTVLMIFGGVNNSTVLEDDQDIMYFYIAPKHTLDLQNPENWQPV
jgi:hypothetical protein